MFCRFRPKPIQKKSLMWSRGERIMVIFFIIFSFIFETHKLICHPGCVFVWDHIALRKLLNLIQRPALLSPTFDRAVVGSWVNPISEGSSTDYEICYHCSVSHFHLESIQFVSAIQQQHCKKNIFLILNSIRVSRGFFLPHVEDWALIADRICSLTSALLNVTTQYSSIYEKESFKSKWASLRAFVLWHLF